MCPLLQPVEATDDVFWDQFWVDSSVTVQDVFALVPAAEIRAVREESPSNLATLCYKVSCVNEEAMLDGMPCVSCWMSFDQWWKVEEPQCKSASKNCLHQNILTVPKV